ncbi:hypothetical protein LTR16_001873 [Cryomyces antarcticus]|uniref:Uncharacterized protein n=1 Tax=Cryomyces antarcticus TaxID=329879 RepID=A0ABR0KTM4_9PEZI|nr:hypothetical protein LTR16_001873 [Cryomyces antarcticus]
MASQRLEEPDPRNSLRHVLATEPSVVPQRADYETPARPEPGVQRENAAEHAPEEKRARSNSPQSLAEVPMYTSTTQTTRRNANGSVSSVYSGNKIRHLKKEDGVPLWRKDIQYEFLRTVFEDETAVFTKYSDGTKGHTFADIYIDAMAKSSKCSKILKEKLLTEPKAAINMAMVCLLVNVGRMNTTLNWMASNGVHAKGLPRQISNYTEQAYHSESEVTRSPSPPLLQPFQVVNVPPKPTSGMNINTLLNETTPPAANPILTPSINRPGPGRGNWRRKNKSHGPPPVRRTPATTTPAPFIMEPQTAMTAQQSTGPHSQDPQFTAGVQFTSFLPPNQPLIANPFTYNNPLPPRVRKSKYDHSPPHSSHLDLSDPDTHPAITPRRTRPLTQHQVAISRYRKERVDYILDRQMRRVHDAAKRRREREGAVVRAWKRLKTLPPLYNSDAEETLALAAHTKKEEHHNNSNNNDPNPNIGTPKPRLPFSDTKVYMAGFAPARTEPDDLAEETAHYARALRKASRRLARWEGDGVTGIRKPEREKRRRERYEREREREREAEAEAERLRFGMERDGGEVGEDGEGEEGGDVAVRLRGGEGGEGYRGKSRGRRRVDRRMEMGSPAPADPDEEDDDGDGGGENGEGEGELDEMDRELLGEVDADESDSEGDGDGDAEGDVDGDVDGDVRMGDAS